MRSDCREDPPGVVVNRSPDSDTIYVGSPSIAVLPDGSFAASHDLFGPGSTRDQYLVFRSMDRGQRWEKVCELRGQWWSGLFVNEGSLYTMGTNGKFGEVAIRRSDDGGRTWTTPKDERSGVLLAGGGYHCAPMPVVARRGRLWRAYEHRQAGRPLAETEAFVMSAPIGCDLLSAENWLVSERVRWPEGTPYLGWREGNAVVAPDGHIVDILRVDEHSRGGVAAMVHVSPNGRALSFDPTADFIQFPGGCKKFTIRRDPVSGRYWSLANWAQEKDLPPKALNVERQRNTLALTSSPDLRRWTVEAVVLYHPDARNVGFQYADWQFEGDDIVAVVRTAFNGATNCHNANHLTFHRIPDFRTAGEA